MKDRRGLIEAERTPKELKTVSTPITRDELQAELEGPEPPILVEALGAAYFADAHLPRALNLPPGHVDRLAARLLPDLHASVVVYGSGACDSPRIVARRLEELGYSQVRIYKGGKEEWVEHGLPVDRLTQS